MTITDTDTDTDMTIKMKNIGQTFQNCFVNFLFIGFLVVTWIVTVLVSLFVIFESKGLVASNKCSLGCVFKCFFALLISFSSTLVFYWFCCFNRCKVHSTRPSVNNNDNNIENKNINNNFLRLHRSTSSLLSTGGGSVTTENVLGSTSAIIV